MVTSRVGAEDVMRWNKSKVVTKPCTVRARRSELAVCRAMENVVGNEELVALIEEQLWRLQRPTTFSIVSRPTLYHLRACKLWKRAFALAAAQRRWDSCHRLLSIHAQPWNGDYRSFVPRSIQYIPGDVGAGKLPPQGVITMGWFHAFNALAHSNAQHRTHMRSIPLVQPYELSSVIPPKPLLWPSAGTAIGAKNDFHHEPSPRFMGRYAFTGSDGAPGLEETRLERGLGASAPSI